MQCPDSSNREASSIRAGGDDLTLVEMAGTLDRAIMAFSQAQLLQKADLIGPVIMGFRAMVAAILQKALETEQRVDALEKEVSRLRKGVSADADSE